MRWLIVLAWLLPASASWARRPEDVFQRQIVITTQRFPMRFSSEGAMTSFLKKHRKKDLWPKKDGTWQFEFMCFFATPLNDLQVNVKFFDLTEGNKRFVNAYDQFTSDRGQRILVSSLSLEKPQFAPNRKYEMVVSNRGRSLASTTFTLRGEGPNYSGKVEFSDQEVE